MNILEHIHGAGLIFNDLKLDNLLFDHGVNIDTLIKSEDNFFETMNVNLIDFGFVTSYINDNTG